MHKVINCTVNYFMVKCRTCKSKKKNFVCQNADFLISFLSALFSVGTFVCLIFNIFFCLSDLSITSVLWPVCPCFVVKNLEKDYTPKHLYRTAVLFDWQKRWKERLRVFQILIQRTLSSNIIIRNFKSHQNKKYISQRLEKTPFLSSFLCLTEENYQLC